MQNYLVELKYFLMYFITFLSAVVNFFLFSCHFDASCCIFVCVFDCRHCRIGVQHNSSCWHWYANWAVQAYCVIRRFNYVPWITQQTGTRDQTAVLGTSFEEWHRQVIGTLHSDLYLALVSLILKCPQVKYLYVVCADLNLLLTNFFSEMSSAAVCPNSCTMLLRYPEVDC